MYYIFWNNSLKSLDCKGLVICPKRNKNKKFEYTRYVIDTIIDYLVTKACTRHVSVRFKVDTVTEHGSGGFMFFSNWK